MNTQANKVSRLPLLLGGIVAVLASGIAIASVALSAHGSRDVVAPVEAPVAAAVPAMTAPAARARRCEECGVIESVREIKASGEKAAARAPSWAAAGSRGGIEATPPGKYEITIRLQDRSTRVITDARPAEWRHGEPVIIIAGAD